MGVVSVLTNAASAPWRPSHAAAGRHHTKIFPKLRIWRVLTTTDVGNVTQGQGVLDHHVLPISGVQHAQAPRGRGAGATLNIWLVSYPQLQTSDLGPSKNFFPWTISGAWNIGVPCGFEHWLEAWYKLKTCEQRNGGCISADTR